ncbi:hypothetical protein FACS189496_3280 [Bacilli bacterium]|nr:hypothetical protein FACS189496_3280 [Bacilli bacterium]
MVFSELNLKTELKKCIEQANYFTLTKIQEKLIPLIINNKDVVAKAPTGTGKTASFVIPIINEISLNKTLQTVVLVPTRELCVQITNEFRRLSKGLNKLFIASIYGGQKSSIQLKLLHASPQIIVATPGRLIDFMENNHIHIKNIKTLVIDEVDQMFNLGFSKDVE